MSASSYVTIWCDVDGCMKWTDYGMRRVSETRKHAKREGWRVEDGKDICPNHPVDASPRKGVES